MKPVGIIANPASGKDIRRMIASGTTVTNREKHNIIIRILRAMEVNFLRGQVEPAGRCSPGAQLRRVERNCVRGLGPVRA